MLELNNIVQLLIYHYDRGFLIVQWLDHGVPKFLAVGVNLTHPSVRGMFPADVASLSNIPGRTDIQAKQTTRFLTYSMNMTVPRIHHWLCTKPVSTFDFGCWNNIYIYIYIYIYITILVTIYTSGSTHQIAREVFTENAIFIICAFH